MLVAQAISNYPALPELDLDSLLGSGGPALLSKVVADLDAAKRSDAVAMVAAELRRQFAGPALSGRVQAGAVTLDSLETLVAPLPGDLREQCLEGAVESSAGPLFLRQLGYDPANLAAGYTQSPLRAQMSAWQREMKVHRIRLVISSVTRWIEETRGDQVSRDGAAAGLAQLAADAGPFGLDLAAWLRVRGLLPEKPVA
jgi:hypothetical protein